MILDTSYLLDLKDGEPDAWSKANQLYRNGVEQKITHHTIFEIYYGVRRAELESSEDYEEERRHLRNFLLMYDVSASDLDDMEEGSDLLANADFQASGDVCGVEKFDAVIGGISSNKNHSVATDNVDDFSKLGVQTEDY